MKFELEKEFDLNKFSEPENKFYPSYSWCWNDVLDKDTIKEQLDEMYDRNIRHVYVIPLAKEFRPTTMVTNLQPEYLSNEYFEMFKFAVDYASEKGMLFGLYDESGWPSGNANFAVPSESDDFKLVIIDEGEVRTCPSLADSTNISATERFIELTHQAYKEHMGDTFNKLAPYIFTDEPDIKCKPYTKTIKEEFKRRYGTELDLDKLIESNDSEFNIKFHDLCSDIIVKNYLKPIREWCARNGIMSTGHLNGEDETLFINKYGYHHPMRLLRMLDIPGVDVIWRQIYKDHKTVFFPRLASSAAAQIGTGLSITESISVYGSVSYEDMRYVTGFQLVRGINNVNYMLLMYNDNGYNSIRQRPIFNSRLPGAELLKDYNKFIARIVYALTTGKPDTKCALYLPIRDIWADDEDTCAAAEAYDSMGYAIEEHHGQFDIIDDDLILSCDSESLKRGLLYMGNASYSTVYIPADKYMTDDVRSRLDIFKAGGGEIIRHDDMRFYPAADISDDGGNIRVHKRIVGNDELYLFFNESAEAVNARLNLGENAYFMDAKCGKAYVSEAFERFESGEMKLFIKTAKPMQAEKRIAADVELLELHNFTMRQIYEFTVDKACTKRVLSDKAAVSSELGDWEKLNGKYYSGECEYITYFKRPENEDKLILTLGKVNYSCRVLLNDKEIGSALMPPYEFIIDRAELLETNKLSILVSNTSANAFVGFKLPDEWEPKHIGPYHAKTIEFEKTMLESGLFGPVKFFRGK